MQTADKLQFPVLQGKAGPKNLSIRAPHASEIADVRPCGQQLSVPPEQKSGSET